MGHGANRTMSSPTNMLDNVTISLWNSTAMATETVNLNVVFLRTVDIVILIACFGFFVIVVMLVIGGRKTYHEYEPPRTRRVEVPQLPVFLRWVRGDSELEQMSQF